MILGHLGKKTSLLDTQRPIELPPLQHRDIHSLPGHFEHSPKPGFQREKKPWAAPWEDQKLTTGRLSPATVSSASSQIRQTVTRKPKIPLTPVSRIHGLLHGRKILGSRGDRCDSEQPRLEPSLVDEMRRPVPEDRRFPSIRTASRSLGAL